jgi:hypothetical protein
MFRMTGGGAASVRACGSQGTKPAGHALVAVGTYRQEAKTTAWWKIRRSFAASTTGGGAASVKACGFPAIRPTAFAPGAERTAKLGVEIMVWTSDK